MSDKNLSALRAEFKALTGKAPSPRLDAAGVQAKIDEATAAKAAAEGASDNAGGEGGNNAENGAEAGSEAAQGAEGAGEAEAAPEAPEVAPEAPEAPEGTAYVRHPEHVGCSFRGVEIAPDKEGLCLVPLSAVDELKSHGFELVK